MNSLRELLDSFPLDDPQRPTIQSDVLRIRAKYKQVSRVTFCPKSLSIGQKPVPNRIKYPWCDLIYLIKDFGHAKETSAEINNGINIISHNYLSNYKSTGSPH